MFDIKVHKRKVRALPVALQHELERTSRDGRKSHARRCVQRKHAKHYLREIHSRSASACNLVGHCAPDAICAQAQIEQETIARYTSTLELQGQLSGLTALQLLTLQMLQSARSAGKERSGNLALDSAPPKRRSAGAECCKCQQDAQLCRICRVRSQRADCQSGSVRQTKVITA